MKRKVMLQLVVPLLSLCVLFLLLAMEPEQSRKGTELVEVSDVYKRQLLLRYVNAGNNNGMAISGLDKSYSNFITGSVLKIGGTPIPNYVWISLLLTAVMWFIWNKTTFGKNMFALGANEEAARVSGVNVFMTTIMEMCIRDRPSSTNWVRKRRRRSSADTASPLPRSTTANRQRMDEGTWFIAHPPRGPRPVPARRPSPAPGRFRRRAGS